MGKDAEGQRKDFSFLKNFAFAIKRKIIKISIKKNEQIVTTLADLGLE